MDAPHGYNPPVPVDPNLQRLEAALRASQAKVEIGVKALAEVLYAHRSEIASGGQVYTDEDAIALAIARMQRV